MPSSFICIQFRAFFKNSSVGGIYKKGPYYTEYGEMINGLFVTKSLVWYRIFVFFYPYDCNSLHFLKQIFGYTALHYAVDRMNLQLSTCIVCLCRYHNLAVTQGTSLINLEGLTPTKHHHGWHRTKEF